MPTIRVLVTFTKFEELQPLEDFSTPPSSPVKNYPSKKLPSSSWLQWMKGSSHQKKSSKSSGSSNHVENIQDPFLIPPDYTWISPEAKKFIYCCKEEISYDVANVEYDGLSSINNYIKSTKIIKMLKNLTTLLLITRKLQYGKLNH